jgi:hypothetical protein
MVIYVLLVILVMVMINVVKIFLVIKVFLQIKVLTKKMKNINIQELTYRINATDVKCYYNDFECIS